ncbi:MULTISPECIES: hypothetical protein [unclassified Duganella]|uniref:hypothetical protein n=1 Tax=unclassified Duganella TaxID=2636909 RepID=UPI000E3494A4|nr:MULTISPECIES: hypothetical protein [unclassified Duganella]RFP18544.1 hypothetical protein D0T23_01700 [Duganella sp. BJB475]RFP35209.1 hypothetical protein D0T21_01700 [Duganella sp. BJB476]
MKTNAPLIATLLAAALLAACGNNPPVPDWQMNAQSSIERSTAAYMSGNARVEAAEYQRAREALASTGKVDLMIRAELIRCAARVASLVFEDCAGYDKLSQDASPADRAYAAYLSGRATAADAALLPAQHQPVASASGDAAAASAAQAIADPLSKLVASGVLLRAGKATPKVLSDAVNTASAQGWRRPLLAWLGVQAMRASQAGDTAEAQRIQRRINLITEKPL